MVEVKVNKVEIRIISGYGPQENLPDSERAAFYIALDVEIERACLAGKKVIISMDANAKLGKEWIPNDRHNICKNGKLLENILKKHKLIVGNGHLKCKGVITRKRVTTRSTEESSIDMIILSQELANYVQNILVDEQQNHSLTRITQTKAGVIVKKSDHNVIITELEIPWNPSQKKDKIQLLNFKDKKCQKIFSEETSKDAYLSSAFESDQNLNEQTNIFLNRLNKVCQKVFRVIRISNKKEKEHDMLYNKCNLLRTKDDAKSKEECNKIKNGIAEKFSSHYCDKIEKEAIKIDTEKGGFNSGSMWKL